MIGNVLKARSSRSSRNISACMTRRTDVLMNCEQTMYDLQDTSQHLLSDFTILNINFEALIRGCKTSKLSQVSNNSKHTKFDSVFYISNRLECRTCNLFIHPSKDPLELFSFLTPE